MISQDSNPKPVLHITRDEKFIDAAYEIYEEALPGQNRFLILQEQRDVGIKHLSDKNNYTFIHVGDDYIKQLKELARKAKVVVYHGLNVHQAKATLALSEMDNLLQIWSVFGSELYDNPHIRTQKIYGNKTFKEYIGYTFYIKRLLRPVYSKLLATKENPFEFQKQAMKKMDFLSLLYEEEFSLYKELNVIDGDAKHLRFTYYPLNVIIRDDQETVTDHNILLGNSATYTNNHLEAFDFLKKMDLRGRKVITPLSYGKIDYAKDMVEQGNSVLGEAFSPLTDFYPLREYQNIIQSCSIVIMNHYRQQGVGNVLNTLYMGAKVYLSEQNTLYHYLNRIGCHICSIEKELKPDNKDALKLLPEDKMEENRSILKKRLQMEYLCDEIRNTFEDLL